MPAPIREEDRITPVRAIGHALPLKVSRESKMDDPETIWRRAFFEQAKEISKDLNTICVQLIVVILLLGWIAFK